jgi:hypothetical protein
MMEQIDEQRELDAVEYAKMRLMLLWHAHRDDDIVPVPAWVMRGLVARATRPHD